MSKENKVVVMATTAAMTISVLAVLIGSGIGWGVLQTKVVALEARAATHQTRIAVFSKAKLDKDLYYKDVDRMVKNLDEMKSDLKLLLRRSEKTIGK